MVRPLVALARREKTLTREDGNADFPRGSPQRTALGKGAGRAGNEAPGRRPEDLDRTSGAGAVMVAGARAAITGCDTVPAPETGVRPRIHGAGRAPMHLQARTEKTILMSDTLTDTTGPATYGTDADEITAEDTASHGRHRGPSSADDSPEADAHGRHRAARQG